MNEFVSICLLAYKRPERLIECIESIMATADFPFELIINLDGGDAINAGYLAGLWANGKISKLILNNGKNRGVGTSFANCVKLSEGDYIFKVDTDLIFVKGWISQAVNILKNNSDVGAVGLFDYRTYDPADTRFNVIEKREDCRIVDDFVSSAYLFRRDSIKNSTGWEEDDGFHQTLQSYYGKLALTKEEMARNSGFGVGNSVYVTGTMDNPRKTETFSQPLVFIPLEDHIFIPK
jgi:glycosyltransferase involved in cell wall biosynthesis